MKNKLIIASAFALVLQSCLAGTTIESSSTIAPVLPAPIVSIRQFANVPIGQQFSNPFCMADSRSSTHYRDYFIRTSYDEMTVERDIFLSSNCLANLFGTTRRTYQITNSVIFPLDPTTDIASLKFIKQDLQVYNQATADYFNQNCHLNIGFGICTWDVTSFHDITNTAADINDPVGPTNSYGTTSSVLFYYGTNFVEFDSVVYQ